MDQASQTSQSHTWMCSECSSCTWGYQCCTIDTVDKQKLQWFTSSHDCLILLLLCRQPTSLCLVLLLLCRQPTSLCKSIFTLSTSFFYSSLFSPTKNKQTKNCNRKTINNFKRGKILLKTPYSLNLLIF